jgi:class 3 adenylate cyclase/tetratricopeptide (TPR) repeat protein
MSDIAALLGRLGLGKYAPVFADNEVDVDVLRRLSEDDLRELGLPLGARRKILQALAETDESGPTMPISQTARRDAFPSSGPERRQITVMFSDVVGSTSLAEQLDAEDLRTLVLAYQQACVLAIERHGGYVAQYLGDGVLAYFGYPMAHEDDAVRAVRASLTIIESMTEIGARLRSEHGVAFEIRIGLHTGLVVAGEMGAGGTREQLAIGETPNVAARVQGLAEPGTVLVSDATWRLVDGFFTAQPLGPQSLKGVSRATPVYRIIAPTGVGNPFEAHVARSLTPLVGREVELSLLAKRWEQANDGEGQAVLVQGEAGIGKSRLVRAFREHLAQVDYRAITFNCSSSHQTSALYPVVDQLSRALELVPGEGDAAGQGKLTAFVSRLALPADQLLPALSALLGIATDEHVPKAPADAGQLRLITFDALLQLVTALSREHPLLFVVEDTHWIDPSTQEWIGHVIDAIRDRQVMMVLTARPEYRAPWSGLAHFSALSLNRLSRRDTEAMIHRVAGAGLPSDTLARLVSRTDGVPLFIEELTKSVLDAHGGSSPPAISVPATLQEALTARLDRLAPVRELIQVAGLLGRVFDVDVVQAVTGLDRDGMTQALADLAEAGLVYRRSQQLGWTFEFKHALIQEVALSTLVRQRRALLHGRIADALQRIRPELTQQQPEVVAHHLQEAGDDRRAWSGWRDAGELAARRSASQEAVEHFTHAADCLKRMGAGAVTAEEEAAIHLGLLDALMQAEGYRSEKLAETMHAAQRAARAGSSTSLQWQVAVHIAPVFYGTGRNGEYLAAMEALGHSSSSDDDPGLRAGLLTTRGIAHFNRGESVDAAQDFQSAIDLLLDVPRKGQGRVGGGDPAVVVHSYLAQALYGLGRLDEASKIAVAGERIGRALNDAFSLAWALLGRGRLYYLVGDYESALADAEEIIAICRRQGFRARLGSGLHMRGVSRAYLGELEQGIEDCREGLVIWRGDGNVLSTPLLSKDLADLLLVAGRVAEAGVVLDDADEQVRGTDELKYLAECQRVRALITQASGDAAGAERWLERAITTARTQGARMFELRATIRLAELVEAQGRRREASRRLGEIYALFTQGLRTPDLREAKALLDRLHT